MTSKLKKLPCFVATLSLQNLPAQNHQTEFTPPVSQLLISTFDIYRWFETKAKQGITPKCSQWKLSFAEGLSSTGLRAS